MYREILADELNIDTSLGYAYFIDYNHPLATGNSGRVYYHRHIASMHLGRWITTNEVVHHIDDNKLNNDIENIEILTQSEHASRHFRVLEDRTCPICNRVYRPANSKQIYCSKECHTNTYGKDISLEDIIYWVTNYSWVRAGKELGISDNGLRKKYTKLSGLDPKSIKLDHRK